jgi:hypothetical protein
MIQDYCRENKVAIHFFCKDELDAICALFGDYRETINYIEGIVSFTRINEAKGVNWNYRVSGLEYEQWYKDYTILTATEFLELADDRVSILKLMG